jgi:hypothetical protein
VDRREIARRDHATAIRERGLHALRG